MNVIFPLLLLLYWISPTQAQKNSAALNGFLVMGKISEGDHNYHFGRRIDDDHPSTIIIKTEDSYELMHTEPVKTFKNYFEKNISLPTDGQQQEPIFYIDAPYTDGTRDLFFSHKGIMQVINLDKTRVKQFLQAEEHQALYVLYSDNTSEKINLKLLGDKLIIQREPILGGLEDIEKFENFINHGESQDVSSYLFMYRDGKNELHITTDKTKIFKLPQDFEYEVVNFHEYHDKLFFDVMSDGAFLTGIINKKGDLILEPLYSSVTHFYEIYLLGKHKANEETTYYAFYNEKMEPITDFILGAIEPIVNDTANGVTYFKISQDAHLNIPHASSFLSNNSDHKDSYNPWESKEIKNETMNKPLTVNQPLDIGTESHYALFNSHGKQLTDFIYSDIQLDGATAEELSATQSSDKTRASVYRKEPKFVCSYYGQEIVINTEGQEVKK